MRSMFLRIFPVFNIPMAGFAFAWAFYLIVFSDKSQYRVGNDIVYAEIVIFGFLLFGYTIKDKKLKYCSLFVLQSVVVAYLSIMFSDFILHYGFSSFSDAYLADPISKLRAFFVVLYLLFGALYAWHCFVLFRDS